MTSQERARAKRLKDNFGLTPEEWEIANAYQNGVCWLCSRPQKSGKRLAVDHDHRTGKCRGLLDSQCNRLLGRVERLWNMEALIKLLTYFTDPPMTKVLGREVFGYAGRCGTKKHRAHLKRLKKQTTKH